MRINLGQIKVNLKSNLTSNINATYIHVWVEFAAVCLLFYTRSSLDTQAFPSFQKPTFPNSNAARNPLDEELLSRSATIKSLIIHLLLFLIKQT